MLPLVLGLTTAAVALTNWWSVTTGHRRVEWWSKLLTLALLLATAAAAGAADTTAGQWLLAALVFGLLGDAALLGDSQGRFLAGVAAFLVGHLAYLVCFTELGLPWPAWSWAGLVALGLVAYATRAVIPTARRAAGMAVAAPLAVYTLVIGAMLVAAWGTGLGLVAAGATVFVVSDSIIALTLARHDFQRPKGTDNAAVMVTYHVGQALIVAGVLVAA